jgi:small subunit ribosomal protein S2
MSEGDVAKLDSELKLSGRITRDGWVDQARSLASA